MPKHRVWKGDDGWGKKGRKVSCFYFQIRMKSLSVKEVVFSAPAVITLWHPIPPYHLATGFPGTENPHWYQF